MSKFGIDVSHYQGNINWAKVKASGKEFVIMKVSQGTGLKDSKFEEYYKGAKEAGLPVGVYIYNKVTTISNAEAEANFAVKCLKGKTLELGVWLDLEDATMRNLGKTALTTLITKEADIIRKAGFEVNIYCNKDWYNNVLDSSKLKAYKFWIARYPSADNGTLLASLKTDYMDIWQYSSKGKVDGINGNVDLNIMYNEEAFFKTSAAPVAKPTEAKNPYKEPILTVKMGSKGDNVKWVQWHLVQLGYLPALSARGANNIDGIFGSGTETAVKKLQKKAFPYSPNEWDGKVGSKTRAKLKER